MTRAGDERSSWWQGVAKVLVMPVWAALTAALGGYYGVLRTIGELEAEVRVVRAEYRANMSSLDRRLSAIEARLPAAVPTIQDLSATREAAQRAAEMWVERHETAYHQHPTRRTE